jgi:hypothetical protein
MDTPNAFDEDTQSMIEEVQSADRKFARTAVADGVRAAQERWIEAPLVAEALMLELIDVAQSSQAADKIAANLRAMATAIEKQNPLH